MDHKPGSKPGSTKGKSGSAARPPSGGISAWESETSIPGADLLVYLGKDPSLVPPGSGSASARGSASSGGARRPSSPRHAHLTNGDGNLAQALLVGRQTAEASRRSTEASGCSGPVERQPSGRQSVRSDGGAGGGGSELGRQVSRLSQPGLSNANRAADVAAADMDATDVDAADMAAADVAAADVDSLDGMSVVEERGRDPPGAAAAGASRLSPWASWSPDAADMGNRTGVEDAGREGKVDAAPQDERLRALLDSEDEGDDDDFQDLMTADDDALFGTAHGGSRGEDVGGGRKGSSCGRSDTAAAAAAAAFDSASRSSSRGTAASRVGLPPLGPSGGHAAGTHGSADSGSGGGRRSSGAVQGECGMRGSDGGGAPPLSARTAISDGAVGPASSAGAAGPREVSSLPFEPAARPLTPPNTSSRSHSMPASGGPLARDSGPGTAGAGVGSPSGGSGGGHTGRGQAAAPILYAPPIPLPQNWPGLGHQPFAPIPTAHLGEGLRPHVPARRYTPGHHSSKSPVRGSGYVMSPAAVRPLSPPSPPSRAGPTMSSHRDSYVSGVPVPEGAFATDADGGTSAITSLSGSVAGGAVPARFGAISAGHTTGGGFVGGAWAVQGSWDGSNGNVAFGSFGRFPAASVQHYGASLVYRSTPINQMTSSATEDGFDLVAFGSSLGGLASQRTSVISPARQNGRHSRSVATPSQIATSSVASASTLFGHTRDRRGPLLAGHSSTSPHRGRPLHSPGTPGAAEPPQALPRHSQASKSPKRPASTVMPLPMAPAINGTHLPAGVDPGPHESGDGADSSDAIDALHEATVPRGPFVPTLPPHRHSTGIRHCGFMHAPGGIASTTTAPPPHGAAGPVMGANGPYGAAFSAGRHKATEERIRGALQLKVLVSTAGRDGHAGGTGGGAAAEAGAFPGLSQGVRGAAFDVIGAGSAAAPTPLPPPPAAADGGAPGARHAAALPQPGPGPGSVQRHGSLPHLPASHAQSHPDPAGANGVAAEHGQGQGHAQHGRGGYQAQERAGGERHHPSGDGGLPLMLAPGARSYSLA